MAIVNAVPKSWRLVEIPRAGHMKLLDEANLVCDVIVNFMNKSEKNEMDI